MITKKKIDSERELLLVFAFCLFRERFRQELVDGAPFDRSAWKEVGISSHTLDLAREVVRHHQGCFADLNREIHACMRICPDPPCPDEESLGELVAAWSTGSSAKR